MPATAKKYQSTTVRVPGTIYERAKTVVDKRQYASSFNELIVEALTQKLTELEESEIDAAFAQMANDPDYQREAIALTREFAQSDWDAFQVGQKHESTDSGHTTNKEAPAKAHAG